MIDAGQRQVGRGAVIEVFVRHAADDCQPIGNASNARHVLRELNARNCGADGLKRAAHVERSVGLGVPHIDLALTAVGEDQNY